MRSEQLKAHIEQIDSTLKPLLAKKSELAEELRDALSIEWIAANSVTREDVASPDEKDLPYFGDIWKFAEHLRRTHCKRRWAAWNGTIYSLAELLTGRMERNAPGRVEHLKR